MVKTIDIDEEQSRLWTRVYVDLRNRIREISSADMPYSSENLPSHIASIFVDEEDVVMANLHNGSTCLIEELEDDVLYSSYRCILEREKR